MASAIRSLEETDNIMDLKQAAACTAAAAEEEPELFKADDFRIYCMKVLPCSKRSCHDWQQCPYAHPGEKAKRRDPALHSYTGIACPNMKQARKCPRGDACPYAHNVFEYWLHPSRYRTQLCKDGEACSRRICFFAHSPAELRTTAKKPHVSPEALASATAAAAIESARAAAPAGEGEQAEVNLLSELLKAHGGSENIALKQLQAQAAGQPPVQDQQQQLVDALATLLLSNGLVHKELPEAQSQPLPAMDDRLNLAVMGKFHSVPGYAQTRRTRSSDSRAVRAHHSVDLTASLAAVAAPVAADNIPDTYNFLAADKPPRYNEREEAAYKAGIAAAMAARGQQEQRQQDAMEFMQSLQQAARAQAAAAAAEAESAAAAAHLHPCAAFLGEGGAFSASTFGASPFASGNFAPQQQPQTAFGATADTGSWTYEAEGMDFTGGSALGFNMGRMSNDSTRVSSDNFWGMDGGRRSRSDAIALDYRCSEDSMRSSMDCAPAAAANWSNFASETAAPASQTPFVNYRLSSLFASSAPFDASATRGF